MPRETWLIGFTPIVDKETLEIPDVDENGAPKHDRKGNTKTKKIEATTIRLFDPTCGDIIGFRLNDDGRSNLVAALTGGVHVPPSVIVPAI